MGTNVYLRSELHEEIVRRGLSVPEFVNEAVEKELNSRDGKKPLHANA